MRYDGLKDFNDEEFRRLTGVMRKTFEKMVNILKEEEFNLIAGIYNLELALWGSARGLI